MKENRFKKMEMKEEKYQLKSQIKDQLKNKHKRGIAALVAALGVVAFWRGSWMLMDIFLFPDNQILSAIASLMGGIIIILILNYNFEDLF
ncbi:conserved hypothetical protein [Lebetimonas natsushimae]|uniref:Uncharacterized protein n=1 Tax=Lebetimonas natsushimae TaxID=1936991 RepID=A0A292YDR3_9BACT|nr:hypothetical protein [Lebetimonas natsushimae]GAX87334.1 conserved hypothetical protein [Lebetimonas natsushimae]